MKKSLVISSGILLALFIGSTFGATFATSEYKVNHNWTSCSKPNAQYSNWIFWVPDFGHVYPTGSFQANWAQVTSENWGFGCLIHITIQYVQICVEDLSPGGFTICGDNLHLGGLGNGVLSAEGTQTFYFVGYSSHVIKYGDWVKIYEETGYGCVVSICDDYHGGWSLQQQALKPSA